MHIPSSKPTSWVVIIPWRHTTDLWNDNSSECWFWRWYMPRVRKSRYWGGNASVPHPLQWRNELSLLVQWRTMYFVLALYKLVCVHRVLSAGGQSFSVLRIRRHTDIVGDSSGRSYITEQWHNVPLLRTLGICHGRIARRIKLRACDVGEAKEGLENELWHRWSNERVGEWVVMYVKRRKGWWMSRDVGEVTGNFGEWALLYISISMSSAHSPTFPSLHLRHNSFSNPSVALPTSQLILQPFHCFTYVTIRSPTLLLLLLRHKLFT